MYSFNNVAQYFILYHRSKTEKDTKREDSVGIGRHKSEA